MIHSTRAPVAPSLSIVTPALADVGAYRKWFDRLQDLPELTASRPKANTSVPTVELFFRAPELLPEAYIELAEELLQREWRLRLHGLRALPLFWSRRRRDIFMHLPARQVRRFALLCSQPWNFQGSDPNLSRTGISAAVHNVAELEAARHSNVSTFFVSPLFFVAGKAPPIGVQGLKELTDLRRPGESFIALGGLNASNAADCTRAGAEGIAVSSAIAQALDPAKEVRSILAALWAEHK
ncbi:MAG: thiamine phosphate synthase [Polyangiaceae bacterium]|nr:thiamine phosphate synthase [Polyangiaceae bacterium]